MAGQRIQRAGRATRGYLQHVGVNHGGTDIAMAQKLLLHIPLIVTGDSGIVTADSGDRDRA